MEISKIHLSQAETELMQNAEIILTKNRVLEKMRALLEEVQEKQIELIREKKLSNDIFKVSPKISKGEYYLGLPYFILDYPRQSKKNNLFFIRTMFWWGNFFSCTLHLAGNSKDKFSERIRNSFPQLQNFFISASEDQWAHHLEETDYRKISSITKNEFDNYCNNFDHLKIAGKHSLNEWQKAPSGLFDNWKLFLFLCKLIP